MISAPDINGFVDPEFQSCFEAFRQNFANGEELGAGCAIFLNGKPILDVWAGSASSASEAPWGEDTVVPIFSVTKGVAAICILTLVSRGLVDLDMPVAHYWPEFAAFGKDRVTVREALGHRAGVPVIDGAISLEDLADTKTMAERLAGQSPIFEPGSHHIYHAVTIGWITSELVRRITGLPLGQWFWDNLARPFQLNIQIGRTTDNTTPVAVVEVPDERDTPAIDPELIPARAITLNGMFPPRLSSLASAMNSREFQAVELAGANGLADARSLARLYSMVLGTAGRDPLISPAVLEDSCTLVSQGSQFGMDLPGPTWGAGFMLPWQIQPMLGLGSFGHDGAGGALAFAHAPSGISFAYVRNRTGTPNTQDAQVYRVVRALAMLLDISIPSY